MTEARAVTIRPLRTEAELHACVRLQHETWGENFGEAVAPAILQVSQRIGGVAAGAFDADDRLIGFVFGLTGVEAGGRRIVHWSDMLAVRPEWRDEGLGQKLKAWQRDAARTAGATVMYWTFDPLVARNAHINFNRLGARAHEYVPDMYGESASVLHRGLGTDRLVVAWPLDREPALSRAPDGDAASLPESLQDAPLLRHDALPDASDAPDAARIAIPMDVHARLAHDPDSGAHWRQATRACWLWALDHGYEVAAFLRDVEAGNGHYLLELQRPASAQTPTASSSSQLGQINQRTGDE